jgi:DNA polymerase
MADGMLRIDRSNLPFDLVLTVHDEILAEVPLDFDDADQVLAHTMSIPPVWAPDLPLAAGGFTALRYRKDG